jgi:hypothetical protein
LFNSAATHNSCVCLVGNSLLKSMFGNAIHRSEFIAEVHARVKAFVDISAAVSEKGGL